MVRQILNPGADMTLYQLQLLQGGIAANNAPVGLDNIGGLARTKLDALSGVSSLNASSIIPTANLTLPPVATSTPTLQGPSSGSPGLPLTIAITNYDVFTTYTLATANGTITQNGATLTYTPSTAGAATFTVNGSSYPVTVSAAPTTPSVTSPVTASIGQNKTLNATSSAFATPNGGETHVSSDWQLATDSGFTAIVASTSADTTNKTTWTVFDLLAATTYYLRVRHNGSVGNPSAWSTTVSFTTAVKSMSDQQAKLTSSDKAAGDQLGYCVSSSLDGTRIIVGAPNATVSSLTTAGAVYVYLRTGTTWTQEAKLTASDAATTDTFGSSVSITQDGTRVVIGAWRADVSSVVDVGAAYVFLRTGTSWAQEAKLLASDRVSQDLLGFSVVICGDGTRVCASAPGADQGATINTGALYVYLRSGTSWAQEAKLTMTSPSASDNLGYSVSMSLDGSRLASGIPNIDLPSPADAGAVVIFSRSGVNWSQEAVITASDRAAGDAFGTTLQLVGDGSRIIIGSWHATVNSVTQAGAAYIYSRSGTTWSFEAKLALPVNTALDTFAWSVGISQDGTKAVVGALLVDSPVTDAGGLYFFTRSGTTWTQVSRSTATDQATTDQLGYSCAISGDGAYIFGGANQADPSSLSNAGAVYAFTGENNLLDREEAILSASDKASNDYFGFSAYMDIDGTRVVVGAYQEDPSGLANAGAAYVFRRSGATWVQEAKLVASDAVAGDIFGAVVSMTSDGTRIVSGAQSATVSSNSAAGAAYVFLRTGTTWTQEAKLTASDGIANATFGQGTSISSDGTRIAIGSQYGSGSVSNAGATYIFLRTGTSWAQESKLVASDLLANAKFGLRVALNSDASRVVIAAQQATFSSLTIAGAAYVFSRSGTTWTQEAKIGASDATASAFFGNAVCIDSVGQRVLCGNGNITTSSVAGAGAVYVFFRSVTTWSQEAKLLANDPTSGAALGLNICGMDYYGDYIVAGAPGSNQSSITATGAAYIWSRSGTTWTLISKLTASNKAANANFGQCAVISGDSLRVFVSALNATVGAVTTAGCGYILN